MLFGSKVKNNTPENEIKKLSRAELLELLIDQTRLVEKLNARNKSLSAELAECKAELKRVASLEVIIGRLEKILQPENSRKQAANFKDIAKKG